MSKADIRRNPPEQPTGPKASATTGRNELGWFYRAEETSWQKTS